MRVHPSVSPSPWLWIRVQVCAQFNLFFFGGGFLCFRLYLLKAVG